MEDMESHDFQDLQIDKGFTPHYGALYSDIWPQKLNLSYFHTYIIDEGTYSYISGTRAHTKYLFNPQLNVFPENCNCATVLKSKKIFFSEKTGENR